MNTHNAYSHAVAAELSAQAQNYLRALANKGADAIPQIEAAELTSPEYVALRSAVLDAYRLGLRQRGDTE